MRRQAIDQAAVECARIGAPAKWIRDLVADCGLTFNQAGWDRYWRLICRLADRDPQHTA